MTTNACKKRIDDPDEVQRVRDELFSKSKFKTIKSKKSTDPIPIPRKNDLPEVHSMIVTLHHQATLTCDNVKHTLEKGEKLYLIERGRIESLVMVPGKIDQRMIGFIPTAKFEQSHSRALIIPPKPFTYHNTI